MKIEYIQNSLGALAFFLLSALIVDAFRNGNKVLDPIGIILFLAFVATIILGVSTWRKVQMISCLLFLAFLLAIGLFESQQLGLERQGTIEEMGLLYGAMIVTMSYGLKVGNQAKNYLFPELLEG